MKKTYIQPSLKTYKVNLQKVLVGSDETEQPYGVKTQCSLGDEYNPDDVSYSKTNSIIIVDDEDSVF